MTANNSSIGEARSVDTGRSGQFRDGAAAGRVPSTVPGYVAGGTPREIVSNNPAFRQLMFVRRLIIVARVITAFSWRHSE